MSLNAVAHELVIANRRRRMNYFIAAVDSSSLSSQQHCGVLPNVMCHAGLIWRLPNCANSDVLAFDERGENGLR